MKDEAKKVLYITDIVGLGGGEGSLLNHLEHLDKKNYPILLCPRQGMLTDNLSESGFKTFIVPWKQGKKLSGFVTLPFSSLLVFVRFLKAKNIHIINANTFNAAVAISLASKLCRIPLVWTCHGWWPYGKMSGTFVNVLIDKVIAVSGFVKDKLLQEGYVKPSKIIQVPLGIDLSKYSNVKSGEAVKREFRLTKNIPLVGMIGRFQKIKGHHIFVKMAAEIIKTHPNVHFMIVGSEVFGNASESDYGREIHDLIKKNGLDEKIILAGFRQDIPQILKALDVLVVPSEIETFGMVVLEAMAVGVPVVSCAKGGPSEIIKNGENGFSIDEQDPAKLSEKVKYLIDNPDIKKEIGSAGKRTVERNYRIENQVAKTEAIYKKLLNQGENENFNY